MTAPFGVRRLDLDDPGDVALGCALIEEYVTFTADEMVRRAGIELDAATITRLVPDLADFAGRYRDGAFLLATSGETVAGGVGITRLDERVCEMNRLWLREAYRGAGRGRLLVGACITHAEALGFERMLLDVAPYRTRAIALYESFGFTATPPIHEYPFEMVPLGRDLKAGSAGRLPVTGR